MVENIAVSHWPEVKTFWSERDGECHFGDILFCLELQHGSPPLATDNEREISPSRATSAFRTALILFPEEVKRKGRVGLVLLSYLDLSLWT